MNALRVRLAFTGSRWIERAEILWDGSGRILRVGRAANGAKVRDVAVLPGLVNAHAHLQLADVGPAPESFVSWVGAVMASRARADQRTLASNAVANLRALLRDGCTAVGEIDSTGLSPAALRSVPFAGRCYQEVTGFHLDANGARELVAHRRVEGTDACPGGLSPHAPYSVSPALFAACARGRTPISVHVAELPEEQQFLREGRGPFRELLVRLGRLPEGFRAQGVGAVRHLERLSLLRPSTLLVHCQELERGDAARIAAGGAPIVVCPGTIDYFGRTPPPVGDWLRRGIPVALGTDSRASNRAMSMLAELQAAARMWPGLDPATLLAMATVHGARALRHPGLGQLRRGLRADFFAVATEGASPAAILEAVVHGAARPRATWLAGRMHRMARSPGPNG